MSFTLAQYDTVLTSLAQGTRELGSRIPQIHAAALTATGHWYLPSMIKESLIRLTAKLTSLLKDVVDIVGDLMLGAVAPVRMFFDAIAWQDIRGEASGVSGVLKDHVLPVDDLWAGKARDAYVKAIRPQSDSADRLAKIAGRAGTSLALCGAAGLAFYVALGFVVAKYVATAYTAITAIGSAVFSWAGVVLIFEETAVGAGTIASLVALLVTLLGTQAEEFVALHGEAADMSVFPYGRWPDPTVSNYADATVKDGDADWSLRR